MMERLNLVASEFSRKLFIREILVCIWRWWYAFTIDVVLAPRKVSDMSNSVAETICACC